MSEKLDTVQSKSSKPQIMAMNGFIYMCVTMSKLQNELIIPKVVATCTYVGTSIIYQHYKHWNASISM